MKNIAIRLTEPYADKVATGYPSLHAYARNAIDCWAGVRKATVKALRRKGFTSEQRVQLRALRPPRGAGKSSLMVLAGDMPALHSKLMMLTETEAIVLAELIRTKKTRNLA